MFGLFKKKKKEPEIEITLKVDGKDVDISDDIDVPFISDEVLAEVDEPPGEGQLGADFKNDYLGMASYAESAARAAIKDKDYDEAWKMLSKVKKYYMQHAQKVGFTQEQTVRLDGTVSEHLANVLRLEGKHADALVHIIYWAGCSGQEISDSRRKKLVACFNRLKLKNTTDIEMLALCGYQKAHLPDFLAIREQVREWREKG